MTNKTCFASFIFVLCIFTNIATAQSLGDRYISGKGNFSILAAEPPTEVSSSSLKLVDQYVTNDRFDWRAPGHGFGVSTTAFGVLTAQQKQELLTSVEAELMAIFARVDVKPISSKSVYKVGGFEGVELRNVGVGRYLTRIFFYKNRLFLLYSFRNDVTGFEEQTKLLDSFAIPTKTEYIAAKMAENEPKALPQDKKSDIKHNDLQDENIKGSVQEIHEETSSRIREPKEPYADQFYDKDGFMTREIGHDGSFVSDITVFGWIDEMRVSNKSYISYPPYEGPNEGPPNRFTVSGSGSASSALNPPDLRFDTKYLKQYDAESRLIEVQNISNTGKVWVTKTISYSKNVRKTLIQYLDSSSQTFETLDANGMVTEQRDCDDKGLNCEVEQYKYTLDAVGNWITKESFQIKTVKGKKVSKPFQVYYRTIKYYR